MNLANRMEELLARSRGGVMCLSVMFWEHKRLPTTVSAGEISHDRNQEAQWDGMGKDEQLVLGGLELKGWAVRP